MLSTTTKAPTSTEKAKFVDLLFAYCDQKYGSNAWKSYMENTEFVTILSKKEKYGDLIFKNVVDFISLKENTSLPELLKSFGNFIEKYY